ncbi:hypothetical protein [Burkholderia cepacia]|uniref:hypothetical protein n=1 Tax=Burkholderia cepacia TaxID=292 RepID=UPI001C933C4A|nr:hypothetical protein [Burkholderia cepacia]MBY4714243.1 hypothetical protein [Burkholderia cepacia]MBY4739148.1 hypothetical protein [Burkholderia cepacia]MBY4746242.1 hypothetical protein [Burkholderia cepacia]MBY4761403.1 hypothetical protein [Burkholderia cepacia]MBY4775266.1 hypothetical protein [Burkholderia cepacia]
MKAAADRAAARFEEHRDGVCRREAANVAARAANPNQQMVLCSAGFVMRRGARREMRHSKKDARCTQRARIPVKEVSHELRVQIAEIARDRQRIDFHIDMPWRAYAARPCVEQRIPSPTAPKARAAIRFTAHRDA